MYRNKIRLGLVPYLNAKPLIYPLLHGEIKHNFSLRFASPARLAAELARGELDIGLVPSVAYTASPHDYFILPNMGISSIGAVRSVMLYSKTPAEAIKSVALDTSSRSSAMLVKIILSQYNRHEILYKAAAPSLEEMLRDNDAALIIGDKALQVNAGELFQFDLGEQWMHLTGYPFVFALYLASAKTDKDLEQAYHILLRAKETGVERIPWIAARESANLGLDFSTCLDYLTRCIYFNLSDAKIAGLERFYNLAGKLGLMERGIKLRFYQEKTQIPLLIPRWHLARA